MMERDDMRVALALEQLTLQVGALSRYEVFQSWGPRAIVGGWCERYPSGVVIKSAGDVGIENELGTLRLVAGVGVAAPEVLWTGEYRTDPIEKWFIMTMAEGTRWNSIPQEPEAQYRTLVSLADSLITLHSVSREVPGRVPTGEEAESWSEWLLGSLPLPGFHPVSRVHDFDALLERMSILIRAASAVLNDRPIRLLHGDLGDGEIYIDTDSGEVVSIVDWGDSLFGDPMYEFARFVGGGPANDSRPEVLVPALLNHYLGTDHMTIEEAFLLDLYRTHNFLRNAAWAAEHAVLWLDDLASRIEESLFELECIGR